MNLGPVQPRTRLPIIRHGKRLPGCFAADSALRISPGVLGAKRQSPRFFPLERVIYLTDVGVIALSVANIDIGFCGGSGLCSQLAFVSQLPLIFRRPFFAQSLLPWPLRGRAVRSEAKGASCCGEKLKKDDS